MQIYVHKNNQQLGPFTEAEIKAQLAAGTITPADHVWWQGQANWLPLAQTPLGAAGTAPLPGAPAAPAPLPMPGGPVSVGPGQAGPTSQLAIWSLVCGCLSIICWPFTSIPAIILGHLSRAQIKKNPALQGGGMALAGLIIGYFFTGLVIAYFALVGIVMATMGDKFKDIFKTINSQIAAAQAANSSDDSTTNSDQSTNSPDQTTPTATPTNSPTATPPSSDSNTNTPTATPTNQ